MKASESNAEFYKAFIKFQGEVKQPRKNATNPHYRSTYSTLDEVIKTVTPTLTKYGLAILQEITGDGTVVTVITRLIHESGEWIETDPLTLKCDKSTPQGQGSAASYGRRYALSAMLGISSEDDNDGNGADKGKPAPATKPAEQTKPTKPAEESPASFDIAHGRRTFYAAMGDVATQTGTPKEYAEKCGKAFIYKAMGVDSTKKLTPEQWAALTNSMDGLKKSVISAINKAKEKESGAVAQ